MSGVHSVFLLSSIVLLFGLCFAGEGGSGVCPFSADTEVDHHHHDDHHGHNHHHHHGCSHDHSSSQPRVRKLPEELAEEEDLALEGFANMHSSHRHHHHEDSRFSALGLWMQAMSCSLLVSMASLICLILLPVFFFQGKPSKLLVDSLAVFGAGAMLGDAFLHQLPHAFGGEHSHGHDHDHSHDDHHGIKESHAHSMKDLSIGLSVLAGILVFLLVEKMVRYIEDTSGKGGHAHHHRHHHISDKKDDDSDVLKSDFHDKDGKTLNRKLSTTSRDSSLPKVEEERTSSLVFGYLNLFSDGVHNFTDGMALGSAFLLHGSVGGWSTTLFLLAHELPQEVGDFGILVRSGFSVSKALFFNFLSALVALAGTALALFLGKDPGHSSLIEAFTAGGFIYISVAGVLPEMNNGSPTIKSSIIQIISFTFGMVVALCISLVE